MDFETKYNNKDILIIGGGTSTIDRKWENIITSDTFIWTCNDFYLNERVRKLNIDLYQLGFQTDLKNSVLKSKLKENKPFTYFEPEHYRGKENSSDYKQFVKDIECPVRSMKIDYGNVLDDNGRYEIDGYKYGYRPAQKSGAMLRLILLALGTRAKRVSFVGFDGFNKEFSNAHAFTGHVGLKDTDQRRIWKDDALSYVNVFEDAYRLLASRQDCKRLQNLGEGLDYNLGTRLSREYFKLTEETYEAIR